MHGVSSDTVGPNHTKLSAVRPHNNHLVCMHEAANMNA